MSRELEEFWADMLSEDPLRVRAAWVLLDAEEKVAIHAHLVRMTTEAGYLAVQRAAAAAALEAIDEYPPPEETE